MKYEKEFAAHFGIDTENYKREFIKTLEIGWEAAEQMFLERTCEGCKYFDDSNYCNNDETTGFYKPDFSCKYHESKEGVD